MSWYGWIGRCKWALPACHVQLRFSNFRTFSGYKQGRGWEIKKVGGTQYVDNESKEKVEAIHRELGLQDESFDNEDGSHG